MVSPEELGQTAEKIALEIAENDAVMVRAYKATLNAGCETPPGSQTMSAANERARLSACEHASVQSPVVVVLPTISTAPCVAPSAERKR